MSSWRPLVAGTVGLFLVVLAFLAGQLQSGGDPALRRSAAAQQAAPRATPVPQQDFGAGSQGVDPQGVDPQGIDPGVDPQGSAPGGTLPDNAPPTTQQS
jgi:hypothetical protein